MPESDDLNYIRHTLGDLTEQVSKLATAMERLATMEERSLAMNRRIEAIEEKLEKYEDKLDARFAKVEDKLINTNMTVMKTMAVAGTVIIVVSMKGSALLNFFGSLGTTP
jgi:Holliday junction resolvasome RuvABC endonuclease subunit